MKHYVMSFSLLPALSQATPIGCKNVFYRLIQVNDQMLYESRLQGEEFSCSKHRILLRLHSEA